jgi:hypothetical protein
METKLERYIEFIVENIKPPYFKNIVEQYGLSGDNVLDVIHKLYDEPIKIDHRNIYNSKGKRIYYESSNGSWSKEIYNNKNNVITIEQGDGPSGLYVEYHYNLIKKVEKD